jgi:mannose/cellobiose epimerase-like protein (N-acyl-D-glucosamine 2-epimerase family)
MERRDFLGISGLLAISSLTDGFSADDDKKRSFNSGEMAITSIAGFSPQELLEKYKGFLFDDFLPFMDKYVVDHEYGGFMCHTNRDGTRINSNKRAWFDGRGIWIYSTLYNSLDKNSAYLEIAKKTADFVLKNRPPGKAGFWPWAYSRMGTDIREGTPDIYGNLFIAEGLAELSKAANHEYYWDCAKDIILNCMKVYDRGDYRYHIYYGPKADDIQAPRVLGHWMVFLRTSTAILSIKPDNEVEEIAGRSIQAMLNDHYIPDFDLTIEVLTHDMKRPDGPFSQFCYTGHVVEAMWMIMYEALRKGDHELFELAAKRFKRHVEVAWDDVYGGIFRCLEHVDDNIWKTDKVLWAQEELLIGAMCLIEQTGDPWAFDWYEKAYRYVMENYPLQKYGYSLWNMGGDRKMTFQKEGDRIENYHHPRHLMLNIQSLERIIKNNEAKF